MNGWLGKLAQNLKGNTYRPRAVRQVLIPKNQPGKFRPLGIPCIRDTVAQTGAMLVLTPIFEADLKPGQYAYIALHGHRHHALVLQPVGQEPQLLCRRPELAHVRFLVPVPLRSAHPVLSTPQIDAGHIGPQHLQDPHTLVLPAAALLHGLSPSTPHDRLCLCVGTLARVGYAKKSEVGESLQASLASE